MTDCKHIDWPRCEQLLRRDPARRGIAGYLHDGLPLATGHLAAAARSLADSARRVAIVTGFAVPTEDGIFLETDGPPGALYLARQLVESGIAVTLVTDEFAAESLAVGCRQAGLSEDAIELAPLVERGDKRRSGEDGTWAEALLNSRAGREISHLVAVERAGPNHTSASIAEEFSVDGCTVGTSAALPVTNDPAGRFSAEVALHEQDHCYNMRGESISHCTGAAEELFEQVGRQGLATTTIGIGDGGNEIGMGSIPWHVLRAAIAYGPAGKVACRVKTDWLVVPGVSNWGAYALACGTARLLGRPQTVAWGEVDYERRMIEVLVSDGGLIDGITGRREATVDGLPLETYLAVLRGIRESFGLSG